MDASEIKRQICEQLKALKPLKKIVVILGPRQVGKTTLLRQLTAGASNVLSFDYYNYFPNLIIACSYHYRGTACA